VTGLDLEPADVNYLTAELVQDRLLMATDRELLVDCQLATEPLLALIDPPRFTQVISNLMTNAVNYTPRGGLVTLGTTKKLRGDSVWVTVTVRDTGRGIPPHEMPHLFERFFRGTVSRQAGIPGTGLGLAICKEIVEQMGGCITVESQPGQGATFTVWLRPAN
jgi:two-component system sensor histidine kinase BaeS